MILVIGTKNCLNCKMVKANLDKKDIEYTYKLNEELSEEELNIYVNKARVKGLLNFPLIVKDEEIITIQEI